MDVSTVEVSPHLFERSHIATHVETKCTRLVNEMSVKKIALEREHNNIYGVRALVDILRVHVQSTCMRPATQWRRVELIALNLLQKQFHNEYDKVGIPTK
jgi:hypothetical protein